MSEVVNPLSYQSIQNSISNFRHVDRDGFNMYDEPGTFWFKPLFYFHRSSANASDSNFNNEGLLHPSWESNTSVDSLDSVTSAYNYLLRNDEQQRAVLLRRFIELLSNISSQSPWYFQEVSGLDAAVDHTENFKEGKFVTDDRKTITFTLLPDAVDTRIGTLFDLYRSVCYSWKSKREILPANLRKFDMGIYIFTSMVQKNDHAYKQLSPKYEVNDRPTQNIKNINDKEEIGRLDEYTPNTVVDVPSVPYKYLLPNTMNNLYLEFTNCEIDLSSVKGGDTMNNADGSERKYTLTISYDDCYVNRFNNFIVGWIGDSIIEDIEINNWTDEEGQPTTLANGESLSERSATKDNFGSYIDATLGRKRSNIERENAVQNSFLDNMIDNITKKAEKTLTNTVANIESATLGNTRQMLRNTVGGILLGNLYHGSLTNSMYTLTSGRLDALGGAVQALTNPETWTRAGEQAVNTITGSVRQNLYQLNRNMTNDGRSSNNRLQDLGNLYKGTNIVSNL